MLANNIMVLLFEFLKITHAVDKNTKKGGGNSPLPFLKYTI